MATWCLPCRDELPLMAGYAVRYQPQGLTVVLVDVREDEAAVTSFLSSLGVSFSTGLDADGSAHAAWGALALPVHFWIDADGIVRDGALGEIGPDIMAHGLQAILPGVTVKP
jgi:cytochrome c biogenesis protein CcmG/thiol:disulfide interchange protein DsbE